MREGGLLVDIFGGVLAEKGVVSLEFVHEWTVALEEVLDFGCFG